MAIPVDSDEPYVNPTQPIGRDTTDDHEKRISILERSSLEQRVRALECAVFGCP